MIILLLDGDNDNDMNDNDGKVEIDKCEARRADYDRLTFQSWFSLC